MKKPKNYWKIKPIKMHFNLDTDRDGVPDHKDCQPFNYWKQHQDWLETTTERPRTESQDWLNRRGKRPKLAKQKYEMYSDFVGSPKHYKGFTIYFFKYGSGFDEDDEESVVYLPNMIYAYAYKGDRGERHNVGIGKNIQQAFKNAKMWIDDYWNKY